MAITLDQHIANMKLRLSELMANERPLFLAAQSALAEMSDRVFVQGKTITGGQYQYNATNPLYVNPNKTFGNTSGLKPPKGKNGDTKFKSGKAHKTTWVESYKALRGIVERENEFVNLEATGDLKFEIENRASGDISPIKVGDNEYVVKVSSKENVGKAKGIVIKYPGMLQFSEKEKQTFYTTFENEFIKLIREELRS